MRTTIELTDEQRAALMAKAARRGLRGFSFLVQEALAQYLGLPAPKAKRPPVRARRSRSTMLDFVTDGFTTGRGDGAKNHDRYIYGSR